MRYAKIVQLCLLLFIQNLGIAQNLVPNPGFENVIEQQCSFTSSGSSISLYVRNWYMPTGGTSDMWFFDSTGFRNCGQNLFNYQERPNTGKYCAGIATSTINLIGTRKPYREYIQNEFIKPLEAGKIYYAEWYVLLQSNARYAANNMGAYFSTERISRTEDNTNFGGLLSYAPQVNETRILPDLRKWVKVSGCFLAKEPYRYVTIGNFFDDEHTSFTELTAEQARIGSYYLIDDVVVREAGTDYLPSIGFLGPDTTLCYNQSITITVPDAPGVTYRGPQMVAKNQYVLNQAGIYSVTATAGQCVVTDTLQLTIEQPVALPRDTVLCAGEQLILAPQPRKRQYQWSDGSSDSTLTVSQAGQYWIRVPSRYCEISDTINVQTLECPGMVPNVITPNGDGKNDAFVVPNITFLNWRLDIYNRWGKRVYQAEPYRNDWMGEGLPVGLYYYLLSNQELKRSIKGWIQIIR